MTERERWIVYPLLFLALGAALRDKLVDRTTARSIVCQELLVVDEQPLDRQPVLLAKIGRAERAPSGAPAGGYMIVNGQFEVVEGDPLGRQTVTIAKVGRDASASGAASGGYLAVNGQLLVDGAINARQYAFHGIPFLPGLQGLPGVSLRDLFHAMQGAAQPRAEEAAPSPNPQPPPPTEPLAEPDQSK